MPCLLQQNHTHTLLAIRLTTPSMAISTFGRACVCLTAVWCMSLLCALLVSSLLQYVVALLSRPVCASAAATYAWAGSEPVRVAIYTVHLWQSTRCTFHPHWTCQADEPPSFACSLVEGARQCCVAMQSFLRIMPGKGQVRAAGGLHGARCHFAMLA